jgi:hypothetical protein
MSGLDQVLQQIGSTADRFLGDKLSVAAGTAEFTQPGRFSFGGLVTLLSLGARDRARGVPASADLSTVDSALAQAALSRLGGPVTRAEAEEALDLLRTGALVTDVASALRVLLRLVRHLPRGLFEDALRLPDVPADVLDALKADFGGDLPTRARDVVADLRDGRRDRAVLPATLRILVNRAVPRDIAETLRVLIGPENRTVRLAVLIYARTHGVDIDEQDLDALHQAIDPDNPDLAPLLNRGLERLEAHYKAAGALAILRRLAPRPAIT